MKASAIVAAIGVGVLATALAKPTGLPSGWLLTGSAKTCEGQVLPVDGGPSPKAFSIDCKPGTEGFSSLMQQIGSADYAGKRVRLSAQVHGDQLAAWGGLWMRADSGQRPGTAFDNRTTDRCAADVDQLAALRSELRHTRVQSLHLHGLAQPLPVSRAHRGRFRGM